MLICCEEITCPSLANTVQHGFAFVGLFVAFNCMQCS